LRRSWAKMRRRANRIEASGPRDAANCARTLQSRKPLPGCWFR
jgi:hypothetical protein